jgi:uncharacterized damage-inducible protein DinB
MNAQTELMKEHVEYVFQRIRETVNKLSEDELGWMPCRGANTIKWILTHMARIGYVLIPQAIQGTVKPEGWDDDYQEQPHSLDELLGDLDEAYEIISELLSETTDVALASPLTIWGRETDRKGLLFHLLAELIHHNGQIAMLRGAYRRSGGGE